MNTNNNTKTIVYDDDSVRKFMIASITWGIVAMTAGVLIAFQLNYWQMNGKILEIITFGWLKNEGIEFLTFGRLRPLHTNAAIFAFVGNMMFAGIYYSTQRLCRVRMASDLLSKINFWGWQFIILCAAISLPAGFTRGKEYAELIWPINIMVAVIWLIFGANFFWTLGKRNEKSIYVGLWFYIATIVTVTMLYVVNHLSIPTSFTHSYPIFGGVQDALVQWWYGHNAVAFFLTTPCLVSCITSCRRRLIGPFILTDYRLFTSGRSSSFTFGPARTTCSTPPCLSGSNHSAWCSHSCSGHLLGPVCSTAYSRYAAHGIGC